MINELNNKYIGTKSQKLTRIVPMCNYIIDKIDSNQDIKRLCRYMTTTPLLNRGKTYDGQIIQQPNLVDSLKGKISNDKSAMITEQVIYPTRFTEDVIDKDRVTIYVHCPKTSINQNAASGRRRDDVDDYTARHLFYVEIVYPLEYENIDPYGDQRSYSIACAIMDEIDGLYVDGNVRDIVGDCRFVVEGEVLNKRLSVTGYGILVIPIWTTIITNRIR